MVEPNQNLCEKTGSEIVKKVLTELENRSGFDHVFDRLDGHIRDEINEVLVNLVTAELVKFLESSVLTVSDKSDFYNSEIFQEHLDRLNLGSI